MTVPTLSPTGYARDARNRHGSIGDPDLLRRYPDAVGGGGSR
jgi:hypothetical protein